MKLILFLIIFAGCCGTQKPPETYYMYLDLEDYYYVDVDSVKVDSTMIDLDYK